MCCFLCFKNLLILFIFLLFHKLNKQLPLEGKGFRNRKKIEIVWNFFNLQYPLLIPFIIELIKSVKRKTAAFYLIYLEKKSSCKTKNLTILHFKVELKRYLAACKYFKVRGGLFCI